MTEEKMIDVMKLAFHKAATDLSKEESWNAGFAAALRAVREFESSLPPKTAGFEANVNVHYISTKIAQPDDCPPTPPKEK